MICTKCTEPIDRSTVRAWVLGSVFGPKSKKLLYLLCPKCKRKYRIVVRGVAIEEGELWPCRNTKQ